MTVNAEAQTFLDINNRNYQLSLMGLSQRNSSTAGDDHQLAVVVSNRIVIRHYQSVPKQIRQLRRQYGGRCGCGR